MAQHVEFEFHCNWVSLTYFIAKSRSNAFLQSWPHKSRSIVQIFLICGPRYTFHHKFRFLAKFVFSEFSQLFLRVLDFSKFSGPLSTCFGILIRNFGKYIQRVAPKIEFEFRSNQDTLTYFTAQNMSTSFFCIHGLQNYIEPSDFVCTLVWWVSSPLLIFFNDWAICGLLADKNTCKGELSRPPRPQKAFRTFCTCFEISIWKLVNALNGHRHISS